MKHFETYYYTLLILMITQSAIESEYEAFMKVTFVNKEK